MQMTSDNTSFYLFIYLFILVLKEF